MEFKPVDLEQTIDLCLSFRRDTHTLSYGSAIDFNIDECAAWFRSLKQHNPSGFEHVILNKKIIGQLEFKSGIKDADGLLIGYINLLYLAPEYRGKGYGFQLEHYIFSKFKMDKCLFAQLRYLPRNQAAGLFYLKNNWHPVGAPGERGQLMSKSLDE